MPIIAKETGGDFANAPAGTYAAICVDVVDLGVLETNYNGQVKSQHKIRLVWQLDENQPNGKPFLISKRYTLSLHEKAGLRKDLESWRGRPFTETERAGFDVEVLLAAPALINVLHNVNGGKTYANVAGIMKLPKSMFPPAQNGYVRVCDRQETHSEPAPPQGFDDGPPITDDDVPF